MLGSITALIEQIPGPCRIDGEPVPSLENLSSIEETLEMCWKTIHTGVWSRVGSEYRELYAFASLRHGHLLLQRDCSIDTVIEAWDKGLLFGSGDIYRTALKAAIRVVGSGAQAGCAIDWSVQSETAPEELPAIIRGHCPTVWEFESLAAKGEPFIITGCISEWPAFRKWADERLEYLQGIAGRRLVPIELGESYTSSAWKQELMQLSKFIKNYLTPSASTIAYLAQHDLFEQIPELADDICLPEYFSHEATINAWFGPKGTVSPLHFDITRNLLAQVFGCKQVRLYSPHNLGDIYPFADGGGNTSRVDPEIDQATLDRDFPKFKSVYPRWGVTLRAGEMLYIPPNCWHHLRSLQTSFSVSFWEDA